MSGKGQAFLALHRNAAPLIMPNPWDAGSARLLESLGFLSLATTSTGFCFSKGKTEGALVLAEVLDHCRALSGAVSVPVSADLEDGYAVDTRGVHEAFSKAAQTGIAGASIEDASQARGGAIYEFSEAVERVLAAAEALHAPQGKLVLTARCENYLYGRPGLAEVIARLQAYQEAGADVLFAPGMTSLDEIRALVQSVDRPVNVNVGLKDTQFSVAQLAEVGVKRISIGSALFRKTYGEVFSAARQMLDQGQFDFAAGAPATRCFNEMMA